MVFTMEFSVHRAETRWEHHHDIPSTKPTLSGGAIDPSVGGRAYPSRWGLGLTRSTGRPHDITTIGGKACNFWSALHQTKKKPKHLQTANFSLTRKGCLALCLAASVSPLSVPVVLSMITAPFPCTTPDHRACTKGACVTKGHSKTTVIFLVAPRKLIPQEFSLVIAFPLFC